MSLQHVPSWYRILVQRGNKNNQETIPRDPGDVRRKTWAWLELYLTPYQIPLKTEMTAFLLLFLRVHPKRYFDG